MASPAPSPAPAADHARIADAIGYAFNDVRLLDLALTHASVHGGREPARSNERLEFLGDRVLGLCVSEMLLKRFPDEAEGDLAKRFTALVRKETLADVAHDLNWDSHLAVDAGERGPDGRLEDSILADGIEALIAAIHLDGGWEAARAFVARYWTARLDVVKSPPKDAKTRLQEWVQAQGQALPVYREIDRHGPSHAPVFTVEVAIEGHEPARGDGRSKRAAEQAAAQRLLGEMGVSEGVFPAR